MIFTADEIQQTVNMFIHQKLDVRAITLGINLLDCASSNGKNARKKCREKILHFAKDLVKVGRNVESEFGIPIINKRISVTPISLVASASGEEDLSEWALMMDAVAKELEVDFIGGFSALVHKGITKADNALIKSIPTSLANTDRVCSSVNVGTTKNGINLDAIKLMGKAIKEASEKTADKDGIAAAKLVVFCNSVEDNPFMAGAFHGIGEGEAVLSVGVSGPGVILEAVKKMKGAKIEDVCDTIKRTAFKLTRVGELVGREAAKRLGVSFGIIDLSLAPTPEVGDSVARILEAIGLASCGTHGSTAALALLTDMVKKGGVMASTHVGGLSGAFIPVSEDEGMVNAAKVGSINLEKLEAMTTVCSVGLDMIAVPGSTPASTISAIIADEAAIGMVNGKTTAVRIIPVPNKGVGETASFGGLLGAAPIIAVNKFSSEEFIERGGRIPPPIHSFRN